MKVKAFNWDKCRRSKGQFREVEGCQALEVRRGFRTCKRAVTLKYVRKSNMLALALQSNKPPIVKDFMFNRARFPFITCIPFF